jgi:hypothetical protein
LERFSEEVHGKMSEARKIRNDTFEILKSCRLDEAEAAVIVCAANCNHPAPKEHLLEQSEMFLREASASESPLLSSKIANAISTLKEARILGESNYYTPFECYYICPLNQTTLISKLSKMMGFQIPKETSETLLQNLNALAKQKQELGWIVQNRVGLPEKLRNFKPTKFFYDVKSKDGLFSFEESSRYLEELDETSDRIMQGTKPNDQICVKTFFAGWLARKIGLISENLAKGVSFSIILLPRPPGSGKQEWTENVKLILNAFKNHKHKLKLKILPADIANHDELILQMTLFGEEHAILTQRKLGDIRICAPCYSDEKRSVKEARVLFDKYLDKSLFYQLLKVAKIRISPRAGMIFGTAAAVLGAVIGTLWSYAGLITGAVVGAVGGVALSIPFVALGYLLETAWPLLVLQCDP